MKWIPWSALIESLAFLALGLMWLSLLVSKKYLLFVAPRLAPFLAFAAVCFCLWGLAGLVSLGQRHYQKRYWPLTVILIPVLLLAGPLLAKPALFTVTAQAPVAQGAAPAQAKPYGVDFSAVKDTGIDTQAKRITLTTENYYETMLTLTKHIDTYVGHDVYAIGFVSYANQPENGHDFTLARYLLFCCVNDITPFGPMCYYDGAEKLPEHQWIAVHGTLTKRNWHGLFQPAINVKAIEPAKEIAGYIYP